MFLLLGERISLISMSSISWSQILMRSAVVSQDWSMIAAFLLGARIAQVT